MQVKELSKKLKKISPSSKIIVTVGDKNNQLYSSSKLEIHGDNDDEFIEFYIKKV